MSELKAYRIKGITLGDFHDVYLKSEADEVITELQKQLHDYAQGLYEIQARAEKELRRQKYKRCLIIISDIKAAMDSAFFVSGEYLNWLDKWHKRWLALANKFKEAVSGNPERAD